MKGSEGMLKWKDMEKLRRLWIDQTLFDTQHLDEAIVSGMLN